MTFNEASQDRANSTYRWRFHLCNSTTDAYLLVGYSKKEGKRECADKQHLLISTLSRLLGPHNRYLMDKAWLMEIFRRRPGSVGLIEEKIADLYQQRYVLHGEAKFDLLLIAFLEAYYQSVHSGTLDQLPPVARPNSKQQEKDDFVFRKDAYANRQVLVDHCKKMLHRYERERVTAYWLTYCRIHHPDWLEMYQTEAPGGANRAPAPEPQKPAPTPEPQKPAPTAEPQKPVPQPEKPAPAPKTEKEATQEALEKLRAKYNKGRK